MEEILKILERGYGIRIVEIRALEGDVNYTNRKFLLLSEDQKRYIFKEYTDPVEIRLASEEALLLNTVAGSLPFGVPRAIPAKGGSLFHTEAGAAYRLSEYIDGEFLSSSAAGIMLARNFGKAIATLHSSLARVSSDILAGRKLFWDLQYAVLSFGDTALIEPRTRRYAEAAFEEYRNTVYPVQHTLRSSLIHGDLNDDNVLVEGDSVKGFIDFGDMVYSPAVNDIAIALAYLLMRPCDLLATASALVEGYASVMPLSVTETGVLPALISTRLAVSLCNSARLKAAGKATAYTLVSEQPAADLLARLSAVNPLHFRRVLGVAAGHSAAGEGDIDSVDRLLESRSRHFPPALSVSYRKPLHMRGARFQYMYDAMGNSYLDAYNNIPHVGHSHPAVNEAIRRQQMLLNTNTRYLYDSLSRYSERLLALFPARLNRLVMVNSGSAATDLALRIARTATGRKGIVVLEHGYHGNTAAAIEISHYKFAGRGGSGPSGEVLALPLPAEFRGRLRSGREYASEAVRLIEEFSGRNGLPAAFIAEPVSGCGGQVPLAPGYLEHLYPWLAKRGIITISDEVQVGFGRPGSTYWGFELHNVVPDIVILGKPMANGHPVGGVITTSSLAETFSNGMEFFSSFGGNPVSCEAAAAVLDVIRDEELQENALTTGNYYMELLEQLKGIHRAIGDVRGSGLFIGIEIVNEDGSEATLLASDLKNYLRDNFILTSTDGPLDNVIKSKPPLCFTRENCDQVVDAIDAFFNLATS